MDSLDETLKIGTQAQTPVIISHHKCAGVQNFGRSTETLKKIEEMRKKHPIGIDVYPYVAGSTMLASGRAMNAQKILVTWSRPHPEAAGKELDEVAMDMNLDRESTIEKLSPAGGIFFMMDETMSEEFYLIRIQSSVLTVCPMMIIRIPVCGELSQGSWGITFGK